MSILSSFRRIGSGVFINITVHSCYDVCAHVFVIRLEKENTRPVNRISTSDDKYQRFGRTGPGVFGSDLESLLPVSRMLTVLTEFSKSDTCVAQK